MGENEKDFILNDYISALIFFENYNRNQININKLDEEVYKIYLEKFKKYYEDNNYLIKIDKKIITENIDPKTPYSTPSMRYGILTKIFDAPNNSNVSIVSFLA